MTASERRAVESRAAPVVKSIDSWGGADALSTAIAAGDGGSASGTEAGRNTEREGRRTGSHPVPRSPTARNPGTGCEPVLRDPPSAGSATTTRGLEGRQNSSTHEWVFGEGNANRTDPPRQPSMTWEFFDPFRVNGSFMRAIPGASHRAMICDPVGVDRRSLKGCKDKARRNAPGYPKPKKPCSLKGCQNSPAGR